MPSSRGSSRPRAWTHNSYLSCVGRQVVFFFFFLPLEAPGKLYDHPYLQINKLKQKVRNFIHDNVAFLGSAAKKLCDLFLHAGYLWFMFSFVQWISWTRILVDSGRKGLDSKIPSIFCRFCGLLSEEQARWLSEFHSACQPIIDQVHMVEPKMPLRTSTVRTC